MKIGKRRIRHAALATCVATLTSLAIIAGGPSGDGQGDTKDETPPVAPRGDRPQKEVSPGEGRTIQVEANVQVAEELDLGAPGRSVGDQFVFSGNLSSAEDPDRVIGRFSEFCVITDLERNAGQCMLTAVLPGGQIAVQGEQEGIPTPTSVTNAITGGTGEFRDAQGQMTLKVLTAATWAITFQVTDH
ncbi:dirigent protein [Streptomyces dysideae]|uniref:Dirigent protein n=1 Tax=Streptomyces dysideae TaxID=909626 RepID=A0A124IFP4_9ACTN|nr:dirigent protein [Streptomyces dysideae]KUO22086.1 hypothetical protein AQJ91_05745 [Streptomyces dysideae]